MLEFGGFLFLIVMTVFLLVQGSLLYNNKNWHSIMFLGGFSVAMYFLVPDWPEFNWKFLVIYPVLALLWLPVYWYLDFARRAAEIKAGIVTNGSLNAYHKSLNYSHIIHRDITKTEDGQLVVNLKHPHKDDLFANALFFPISIPVFFGESAIRMVIDYITGFMEDIRKKFNDKLNNFKV